MDTAEISRRLDFSVTESRFSGVVRVALAGRVLYERAAGFAERGRQVPNTHDTAFAVASGTKSFTALAVLSLVAEDAFTLDQGVKGLLGQNGDLVESTVTIRHLLTHTSGIGDYLDEDNIEDPEDYVLDVPVHRLACPADFRSVLRGHPQKFPPGAKFAYCNSGYVLLALLIEAVSGQTYFEFIEKRVFAPAGMKMSTFPRLDTLPGTAAVGYLQHCDSRANYLHLPVRGAGDGGAYSTLADVERFWVALFSGHIVPLDVLAEMTMPLQTVATGARQYGLGFWLNGDRSALQLEGCDTGVSFRSAFEPATGLLYTVMSNTTSGAWPIIREIESVLPGLECSG